MMRIASAATALVLLTGSGAQAGDVEGAFRAVVAAQQDAGQGAGEYARPAASGKGVAITRDEKVVMASKDVGQERWSIIWGDNLLRIRGLVYSNGGGVQFIECDVVDIAQVTDQINLKTDAMILNCYGGAGVVPPSAWDLIAVRLRFPLSFFLP